MNDKKHTVWELKQKQSLPLSAKVLMTKKRIKSWHTYFEGNVYVSFSGGKDSTVLKHIVESIFPDVPAVFCNTGLEYPEVKKFAMSQDNVTVITPKMMFKEVIEKYGYPVISKEQSQYINQVRHARSQKTIDLRLNGHNGSYKISEKWKFLINAPFQISEMCCNVMKKAPFKEYEKKTGRKPIIGTMCEESMLRLNGWLKTGCNAFESARKISKPLSFWTEQDILQYIVENDLKIASVYGEVKQNANGTYYTTGANRTGCMFCLYGIQNEKEPNRIQRMQSEHPRQYQICIEQLGIKEVLEFMDIPYKVAQTSLPFEMV